MKSSKGFIVAHYLLKKLVIKNVSSNEISVINKNYSWLWVRLYLLWWCRGKGGAKPLPRIFFSWKARSILFPLLTGWNKVYNMFWSTWICEWAKFLLHPHIFMRSEFRVTPIPIYRAKRVLYACSFYAKRKLKFIFLTLFFYLYI